ncbi:hypothetical protein AB4Y36_10720 [Paraburkholderia sp. BR10936]|uniref:hypothetical protein n=1 Tax=Paraburkholderia sp. BR10936 TaxID=3236993 RepID=UPI0034D23514
MACGSFSKAFEANMAALGLPAPTSLFSSVQAATGNLATMLSALKTLGPNATVAELIGATTGLEALGAVGAILAAAYCGAVIGSLIVAADAAMVCTSTTSAIPSVQQWAMRNGVHVPPSMYSFISRHPEVLIQNSAFRPSYAYRMRKAAAAKAVA